MSASTAVAARFRRFLAVVPLAAAAALTAGCGGELPSAPGAVCGVQIDAASTDVIAAAMRSTGSWDCGAGAPAQGVPTDLRASDLEVLSVETAPNGSLRVTFRVVRMRAAAGQCGHLLCDGNPAANDGP